MCSNIRAVDQDLLKRFMVTIVGTDWFIVTDLSHLHDFLHLWESVEQDLMLDAIEREFGVRLPHTDFYLWEALRALSGVEVLDVGDFDITEPTPEPTVPVTIKGL
jgi:hypothetical protein